MKKKLLLALFLLTATITLSKVTIGQEVRELPPSYLDLIYDQPRDTTHQSGPGPYVTHPEITNIMTTTVTVPPQDTSNGYIFVAPPGLFYPGQSAIMILEESGEPIYIKTIKNGAFVGDFKVQTVNGENFLTYHVGTLPGGYTFGINFVMDQAYNPVDTWTIYNGFGADLHDFILLDNGNAIVMAYDLIEYDLSPWGGPVNGTLVDILLQEQDPNKNVVFEWRASEHLPIGDTHHLLNTTDPVDFLHTNAIEVDFDGNWLLSHRHFSEVTKISRQTGEIIWRLGGRGNEFTFTNDIGFWVQHDIRRQANGNITIFDNGNFHIPAHSRAIEYAIDEVAKTVTRVWSYPEDGSEYSDAMANFQRLANGNSFIGWGTQPKASEVLADGTLAYNLQLGVINYRAFRFPWSSIPSYAPRAVLQFDADPTAVTIYTSWNGATDITGYEVYAGQTLGSMSLVTTAPKTSFETTINVSSLPLDTCFFRTKPIHAQSSPTSFSNLMFRTDNPTCLAQLKQAYMPILASQ